MKKIKEEYFYTNDEFYSIINDIITNDEFIKTKYIRHHGITRYNHSLRVAYHTFLVTKKLKLNYKEATRAALLHDFFLEETKDMNQHQALRKHPEYALKNAKKYFELSHMQEDIILKHMYPITKKMPKYKESWIVDIIDDYCSLYERTYSINNELRTAYTFLFIFLTIRFK
mgnify:FL=1|jgi:uncharacterized protein